MDAIVYTLVARGHLVLAEYTDDSGNFMTVTQSILDKLPPEQGRRCYTMNDYLFQIEQHDDFTFLALSNPGSSNKVAFAMLGRIRTAFMDEFAAKGRSAHAYSLESSFGPVLRREMAWANKASGDNALLTAQRQVDEVKDVMVQNIEKVLQRGEQIDLLVDKADNLELEAGRFNKNATKLRKKMWWKNMKCQLMMVFIFIALIIVIVAAAGGFKKRK
eukprot:TRINITY_DN14215_c0_g1_i1.p1 TRINITY_DN14215_c0_g1~~TRINITY_DN14215_c0_g1_i1.p1  ORF type:complete len:217 (+),score=63.14 TRINITY_DN14215_c0_g1_i1:165-815(+)